MSVRNKIILAILVLMTGQVFSQQYYFPTRATSTPAAGSVDSTNAQNLTATDLINGAILNSKIAASAVDSPKVKSGQIPASKLATGAVLNAKIASAAVDSPKVKDSHITSTKIKDGEVNTSDLANASVDSNKVSKITSSNIRDAAVGATQLAPTTVTAGSYTSTNLTVDADGRITAASDGTASTDYSTTVNWVEEFVGGGVASTVIGDNGWSLYREAGSEVYGFLTSGWSTNNWGELFITPNSPTSIAIYTAQKFRLFNNGYFEARVSVPSTAASEELFVGMGDVHTSFGTVSQTDGVGFIVDIGTSANWIRSTCKDATRTETASSTAVTTGYHVLKFVVNDGRTSIEFFVDGVSIGSNTTNIPTGTSDIMELIIGTRSNGLGPVKMDLVHVNFVVTR